MAGELWRRAGLAMAALAVIAAAPADREAVTGRSMGGVALGAGPAAVRARFGGARLHVVADGPWAAFRIEGARVTVGFDGEGRELRDGRDSLAAIGTTVGWDALRPELKVRMLETTSPDLRTADGLHVGAPARRDGAPPAERIGGEAWAHRPDGVYVRLEGRGGTAVVAAVRVREP